MNKKNIGLLAFLVLFVTVFEVATSDQDIESSPQMHKLSDRILVLTSDTPTFNNVTAISTDKGIVVVDTTPSPATAARLRTMISNEFDGKVFAYTINTHHHWDHFFGNQAFADTIFIGHERAPQRMRELIPETGHPADWLKTSPVDGRKTELEGLDPDTEQAIKLQKEIDWFLETHDVLENGFEPIYPTLTFNDRLSLNMGDLTIDLYYYGQADSNNSILVHVPEEGLVVAGDLYWFGGMFTEFGDGLDLEVPRWIETLDTVLGNTNEIKWLVGGHQSVWPGEHLKLRRDYIVRLWGAVGQAQEAGLTLEEAKNKLSVDQYPELEQLGFKNAYDEEYTLSIQQADNVEALWQQTRP